MAINYHIITIKVNCFIYHARYKVFHCLSHDICCAHKVNSFILTKFSLCAKVMDQTFDYIYHLNLFIIDKKKNYFRFPWTFNKCALLTFLSKLYVVVYCIALHYIKLQCRRPFIMIMNFVRWSQVSKNMNTLNWSSTFLYVSMLLLQDIMCMIKYCVFRWLFVNCTTKNPIKVLATKNFL